MTTGQSVWRQIITFYLFINRQQAISSRRPCWSYKCMWLVIEAGHQSFYFLCRCAKMCAATWKAAQKKSRTRPLTPWRPLTDPEGKTAPTATAAQRDRAPRTTAAGDTHHLEHFSEVTANTPASTPRSPRTTCTTQSCSSHPAACYFPWMGFCFCYFARCCSVSLFSPLVKLVVTHELLRCCTSPSLVLWQSPAAHTGALPGAWPRDQKPKWWYYFLYCSLWISFNSIVCFTGFSISLKTKCL